MGRHKRTALFIAVAFTVGRISGVYADPPTVYAPVVEKVFVPITLTPRIVEPSPTPSPGPTPTIKPALARQAPKNVVSITGTASWYRSWCNCNAMTDQRWRGKTVRVSGPAGSTYIKITDAGPVPSLHRVADLNPTVFMAVCGSLKIGTCRVTITGP